MSGELCGMIGVYKPMGWTSFDVVAKLRGVFRTRKIGHGGTLDPLAEGVLPVMVGRATKAIDLFPDNRKEYTAGFRLGVRSDTQDITGELMAVSDQPVPESELREAAGRFIGEQTQIPPMYSAVKVGGKRLYELARDGRTVDRQARTIQVYSISIESYDESSREGVMKISCGKGTYVRTLISDMGDRLETGAIMTSLTRTWSGGFGMSECMTPEEIEKAVKEQGPEAVLLPVERAFGTLPEIFIEKAEESLYRNGVKLRPDQVGAEPAEGLFRVKGAEGFIGVGKFDGGLFRTVRFF